MFEPLAALDNSSWSHDMIESFFLSLFLSFSTRQSKPEWQYYNLMQQSEYDLGKR